MSQSPDILLIGQADHDNFGDSLIFAVYVAKLNALGINPKIVDATPIFMQRLSELGLSSTTIDRDQITNVQRPAVAVFIGGGYLGQPELSWPKWQLRFIRDGVFLDIANKVRNAAIPLYVEGPEFGPYYGPFIKNYIKSVLSGAKSLVFRNTASLADAQKLGFSDAEYVPDVVLCSMDYLFPDFSTIETKHGLTVHATRKLFSDHWVAKRQRALLAKVVADHGFSDVSVLFDQRIPSIEENAQTWLDELGVAKTQIVRYEGVEPLCRHLASVSHVITTKLHVGVTALSLGKRVVCLSSGHKNRRFYQDVGLPGAIVDFYFTSTSQKFAAINAAFGASNVSKVDALKSFSAEYLTRVETLVDAERS